MLTTALAAGSMTNQLMPARLSPRILTPVSRAPKSLPSAYQTCCIRLSFESSGDSTSSCAGSCVKSRRQQPLPAGVLRSVSLMHWRSGRRTRLLLGTRRHRVPADLNDRPIEVEIGIRLAQSVLVPVSDQTRTRLLVEPPGTPLASSAASDDRKNSVPPLAGDGGALRSDGRPHREPGLAVEALTIGVELLHRDVLRRAGQGLLGEGVDLGGVEDVVGEERVLVRREVEAAGVGAHVRVVAEARTVTGAVVPQRAVVVGRALGAVVLHRDAVDGPGARRVGAVAHGQVEVVLARELAGLGLLISSVSTTWNQRLTSAS